MSKSIMDEERISKINYLEKPYDLIDGAEASGFSTSLDVEDRKKIIADPEASLDEKIEAFEDVIDSEVGDTSLYRARNLEREIGLRQIYLKFEGGNPTGTQKDRIAFAQALDALRRGFDTISLATCGNYGVACALAASIGGLRCLVYIPETYHTKRLNEIENLGAEIVRVKADYENAVKISTAEAIEKGYYDANPGGDNITLQLKAYGQIAYEIYDELRDAPKMFAAPVSNGTTIAGIYRGFLSLYRRGKTSRIPKLIAGSSFKKNPIVQAILLNKQYCEDLSPEKIKESKVNEPLINWHSIDGDFALDAIRNTQGWADDATDKEMLSYSKLLKEKEGMNVLPASTAGLAAFINKHKVEPINNDRFVILLTGRQ
ncbi:MAG: pyridoxal-phosphate dependent enzyme [Melioribacteraceae bacterium]|nr:pyridoxal-phosphate dependent enzyme [Melioribacteraceae bacterium]